MQALVPQKIPENTARDYEPGKNRHGRWTGAAFVIRSAAEEVGDGREVEGNFPSLVCRFGLGEVDCPRTLTLARHARDCQRERQNEFD